MRALAILLCLAARLAAAPLDTDRVYSAMVLWEGHRLVPYKDQDGWSVGVGHSLTTHAEPVRRSYSRAEVYQLFLRDYAVSLEAARAGVIDFDELSEEVRITVLGIIWTVGPTGFMRFKDLRVALSRRAWSAACVSLYLSKWYRTQPAARANSAINTLRTQ